MFTISLIVLAIGVLGLLLRLIYLERWKMSIEDTLRNRGFTFETKKKK